MKVTASILIPPQEAYNTARVMSRKKHKLLTTDRWYSFLKSEHSPIRVATYRIILEDLPYWVSVHFTRHKIGVEHFVSSRRPDRTGQKRSPEDLVRHEMVANAQALITMARKRLCRKASPETLDAMLCICAAISLVDIQLYIAMAPDCVYRGVCHEMQPCGLQDQQQLDIDDDI
jgi:hypothetical protein